MASNNGSKPPLETKQSDSKIVFNSEGYPEAACSYILTAELGKGGYATVYRAECHKADETLEEVAVKVLDLSRDEDDFDQIVNEVSVMSQLRHPNVLRKLSSFVEGKELWIITPLLAGGSCKDAMKVIAPNGFEDESIIATIMHETVKGLEYLHARPLIHRDIKAGNILIGATGEIELADFGVAASFIKGGERNKSVQTFVGTPNWMAPEVVEHSAAGYNTAADIWSLGITALELAYGVAPYSDCSSIKVMMNITGKEAPSCTCYNRPERTAKVSKEFKSFIAHCLHKDPRQRPSATQLLKEPWFKKHNEDAAYIKTHVIDRLPKGYLGAGSRTRLMRSSSMAMAPGAAGTAPVKKPQSVSTMGDCEWRFGSEPDMYEDIKAATAMGVGQHRFQQTGAVVPSNTSTPAATAASTATVQHNITPPVAPVFANTTPAPAPTPEKAAPAIPTPVMVPPRTSTTAALPAPVQPMVRSPMGLSVVTATGGAPTTNGVAPSTPANHIHVIPTRAPPLLHSSSAAHLPGVGITAAPPTPSAGLHFGNGVATNGLSRAGMPVAGTYAPPAINPLDYPVSPRATTATVSFEPAGGVATHRFFHTTPATPSGASANRSPVAFTSNNRPPSPAGGVPTTATNGGPVAATYLPAAMPTGIRASYSTPSIPASLQQSPPSYLEEDHACHHHPVAGALAVSTNASVLRFGSGGTLTMPLTPAAAAHNGIAPGTQSTVLPMMTPTQPQAPRPASPAQMPAGFIQLNTAVGRRTSYGVTKDVGRFKVAE